MLQNHHLPVHLCSPSQRVGGYCRQFARSLFSAAATPTLCAVLLAPVLAGHGNSAKTVAPFKPKTMAAFATYVRMTDSRNNEELQQDQNFLWIDTLPEAARNRAYKALAQGEVQIERRRSLDNEREIACPDGMIHHWEGLIFVPGAKMDGVLKILQDYDRHSVYYAPDVARSKLESRDGDHFKVFLRFRRQKIITVVLNTEHDVHYFRDAPGKAHSRSSATRIAEVDNPGKPNETEKSREDDGGFLWGMETWWRLLEKDGGVYVQSEVVSLTRDIPAGLGWMIGPFVNSIPKETLTFTLEATRKATLADVASRVSHRE